MAIYVRPSRNDLVGLAGPALLARESDERLVELVRDGDENAFAAIVDRYRRPLERHCRRTLPAARAEDALQQAFASAYVALSRGARPAALRPWLYAIAHNAAINGLRDRQPESLDAARELGDHVLPHDIVTRRESLRSVLRAVVGLPARQRQVIVRQEFDGESHEQIARELGLTTGAVRQLAHRARCTVRAAAAALIPAPLWQRMPWVSGPSDGAELFVGSAFGVVAAKTAAAILVAGAAGGAVEPTAARTPAPASPAAKTAPRRAAVAKPPARPAARPAAARATTPAATRRTATFVRVQRDGSGRSRAPGAKRRREAGSAASTVPAVAQATAPAQPAGGPVSGAGQHAHHGPGGASADVEAGGHGRGRGHGGGGGGGGHGHGRNSGGSHGTSGSGSPHAGAISAAPAEVAHAVEVEHELAPEPEPEPEPETEHEPGSSGVNSGSTPPDPAPVSESSG
jgi:RNA polymerase sigma factor (sigma-70 family)